LNEYELDRRTFSLEEEKPRKVMQQSFNVEGLFLRRRNINKEEGNLTDVLRKDKHFDLRKENH